ncbi:23S rRNA (adenine(1618)-N(6))-methyltransferase [Aureococcus anophagefferens]|nr:23S rRNA (adenine(1618)-N(6))-methyltransferase [Aureococcus anophagefferens]
MATAIIDVVTTLGNTLGPAGYRRVTTASGGPFDLTRVSTSLGGSVSRAGAVSATAVFLWTKRGEAGGGAVTGVRLVGDGASPGEASDEFGVGVGSERLVFSRGAGRAVSELVGELEAGDGSDGRESVRLGSGAALRVARVGDAEADAPGAAPRAAAASGAGPAAREAAELEDELVPGQQKGDSTSLQRAPLARRRTADRQPAPKQAAFFGRFGGSAARGKAGSRSSSSDASTAGSLLGAAADGAALQRGFRPDEPDEWAPPLEPLLGGLLDDVGGATPRNPLRGGRARRTKALWPLDEGSESEGEGPGDRLDDALGADRAALLRFAEASKQPGASFAARPDPDGDDGRGAGVLLDHFARAGGVDALVARLSPAGKRPLDVLVLRRLLGAFYVGAAKAAPTIPPAFGGVLGAGADGAPPPRPPPPWASGRGDARWELGEQALSIWLAKRDVPGAVTKLAGRPRRARPGGAVLAVAARRGPFSPKLVEDLAALAIADADDEAVDAGPEVADAGAARAGRALSALLHGPPEPLERSSVLCCELCVDRLKAPAQSDDDRRAARAALLGDLATVGDGGGPGPGDPALGFRGGGTMVEVRRARRVHVEHRRGASLLAAALDAAEAEKAAGGPAYRAALDLALALASDALVVVNSLQHAVP